MNTRIKELALQSDLLIKKTNGDEFRYGYFDPKFEKFAQLIIQEVIAEFYDEIQYNFSIGYAKEITDSVKQRFGISS